MTRSSSKRVQSSVRGKDAQEKVFVSCFLASVSEEEKRDWTAATLSAAAQDMYELAQRRSMGQTVVRFSTAVSPSDGDQLPSTVIEIISDDMAFVVDSVAAELAYQGLNIERILHPILQVKRDSKGNVVSFGMYQKNASEDSGKPESFVYVHLEQALTEEHAQSLSGRLIKILQDVQRATADWPAMLEKMDHVIATFGSQELTAEEGEERDLLSYLRANNFTFLGYQAYRFGKNGRATPEGEGLGVLCNVDALEYHQGYATVMTDMPQRVMVRKLVDCYSTVHRRVPMDAISIKILDRQGRVCGMHQFLGLFTSSTYSCRTADVPMVREKVRKTIVRTGFGRGGHDYRALEHILEKMPRDELFQVPDEELYHLALGILHLQDKPRVALFTHQDLLRQYMCCLVYVPRDKYNTTFRRRAAAVLESTVGGALLNHFVTLDDSSLARILFMVRLPEDKSIVFDQAEAERRLCDLGREWDERLRHVLVKAHGRVEGLRLTAIYGQAFTTAYHESINIENALHDIRHLESLEHSGHDIRVELYRLSQTESSEARLKVYNRRVPVPLSAMMPVLDNMGLTAISETPFEVKPSGRESVWIHDFVLSGAENIDLGTIKENFEEAFIEIWRGQVENDVLNRLILRAGLNWRQTRMFRAYGAFLRQARFPYSATNMAQALSDHPQIVRALVKFFYAFHDPQALVKDKGKISAELDDLIQSVERVDHDRILRLFRVLIEKTLRTNYFQSDKQCVAFKLESRNIEGLPLPRPHVEIFVYSARVEAVHLRNGEIARGGIRWSDRPDDFRTEILGLVKAQSVKNTVIVPTGAKGGFVVKRPPTTGGREAFLQEGIACYQIFVQALLDLTDNDIRGKISRPKDIVCHDGPDPYLVVAADKGTAKFSDIANTLSLEANFWLADAFASGGSSGYDHKDMGITARGGWESVKRHFRDLGRDVDADPFLAVGVGDMGGDVFGNAMLLSKQIRLVGAFNHVHIFCDPNPDPEVSYAERNRLFEKVLGWDSYDRTKLSVGGAVFERSAKTLKISPQIRERFELTQDIVTPEDLMKAILKAQVDLLWLGGIGTFVKSAGQSHADADDKANDALRIDGRDLRAKVVGEGANLGFTQLGRIEYARMGGRINTDFIDNSGGVDCSDHEVNIKILLSGVMAQTKMSLPQRNVLLRRMTDEVSSLVLKDNYQQNLSLALQLHSARDLVGVHAVMIETWEKAGILSRFLEGLPDTESFARLSRDNLGLTRPELCILMSWAKIDLYRDVIASTIPDDSTLEWMLFDYFPVPLRKYTAQIKGHRLKREIIATQVVNLIVNRMGAAFVYSRMQKTGATAEDVVRAFLIVMEAFDLRKLWQTAETMDGKGTGPAQISALHEIYLFAKRAVTWFLRFGPRKANLSKEVAGLKSGIEVLRKNMSKLLPPSSAHDLQGMQVKLEAQGLPAPFALEIAITQLLTAAGDIISIARAAKADVKAVALSYFRFGRRLEIDGLKAQAALVRPANSWQARVLGGLVDDYYIHHAAVTRHEVETPGWLDAHPELVAPFDALLSEMRLQPKPELDMLVLAGQRLGQMASGRHK